MEQRQKIKEFVDSLTGVQCAEQLILAYLQMERCIAVLHGEDAEPVDMMDNGLSSDLELFYACKGAVSGKEASDE